jgi:predicted nucleic acid-binding protein
MTASIAAANAPVFVDTNILIYAKLAASPWHVMATSALQALAQTGTDLWISRQVLREYLAATTRPNLVTPAIPVAALVADVRDFARHFLVAEDTPLITEALLDLMLTIPIAGKQVHDANIVATMQVYGIRRLLTHNTDDFARFAHLIEIIPLNPAP